MDSPVPLAEFARASRPPGARPSSRVIATGLTALLYGLLALIAWLPGPTRRIVIEPEIFAVVLPDRPRMKDPPAAPSVPVHFVKPHVESISPPSFSVAPPPAAPATLLASAAPSSPILGGAPSGAGAGAGSGPGGNGSGAAPSGCFDAVWARAVTDHIAQYFYRPRSVRHENSLVLVDFTVRRNGSLIEAKIGKGSGDSWLDRLAIQMVRRAAPMPAMPDRMHMERIEVELPMSFDGEDAGLTPSPGTCG